MRIVGLKRAPGGRASASTARENTVSASPCAFARARTLPASRNPPLWFLRRASHLVAPCSAPPRRPLSPHPGAPLAAPPPSPHPRPPPPRHPSPHSGSPAAPRPAPPHSGSPPPPPRPFCIARSPRRERGGQVDPFGPPFCPPHTPITPRPRSPPPPLQLCIPARAATGRPRPKFGAADRLGGVARRRPPSRRF